MAIAVTGKTAGTSTTAATTYATASITPTAGSLLIAWVVIRGIGTAVNNTASGLSGTWVNQGNYRSTTGLSNTQFALFTCANWTGSGAITFGNTDAGTSAAWSVMEATGVNMASPIAPSSFVSVTSGGSNVSNLTLTLNSPASANNRPIVFCAGDDQDALAIDWDAPYTEFAGHDVAVDLPPLGVSSAWCSSTFDTTARMVWNDGITYFTVIVGAELVAASAARTSDFFNFF